VGAVARRGAGAGSVTGFERCAIGRRPHNEPSGDGFEDASEAAGETGRGRGKRAEKGADPTHQRDAEVIEDHVGI